MRTVLGIAVLLFWSATTHADTTTFTDGEFEEAYDFFQDPLEQHNLVETSPVDPRVERCRIVFDETFGARHD